VSGPILLGVAALKALLSGAFLHDLSASVGWSSLHTITQRHSHSLVKLRHSVSLPLQRTKLTVITEVFLLL